jgi:ribosome-associated protein
MDNMLSTTENSDLLETAKPLAELLQEHNGQDVCLLDIRGINDWADFFIIATISSRTHMDGLERHIKDFCRERGIEIFGVSPKSTDDEWRLIDLGAIIIHLMNSRARDFYELEKLWRNNAGG